MSEKRKQIEKEEEEEEEVRDYTNAHHTGSMFFNPANVHAFNLLLDNTIKTIETVSNASTKIRIKPYYEIEKVETKDVENKGVQNKKKKGTSSERADEQKHKKQKIEIDETKEENYHKNKLVFEINNLRKFLESFVIQGYSDEYNKTVEPSSNHRNKRITFELPFSTPFVRHYVNMWCEEMYIFLERNSTVDLVTHEIDYERKIMGSDRVLTKAPIDHENDEEYVDTLLVWALKNRSYKYRDFQELKGFKDLLTSEEFVLLLEEEGFVTIVDFSDDEDDEEEEDDEKEEEKEDEEDDEEEEEESD